MGGIFERESRNNHRDHDLLVGRNRFQRGSRGDQSVLQGLLQLRHARELGLAYLHHFFLGRKRMHDRHRRVDQDDFGRQHHAHTL
jgi:hypothetical protein